MLIVCTECRRQYDVTGIRPGETVRCRCNHLIPVAAVAPREARVLRCSACGALLEGGANCAYCGSEVSAAGRGLGHACPQCFAQLPVGARFCCECGLEIKPEAVRVVPVQARCPRCTRPLARREVGAAALTECSSCAGLWLDEPAFEQAVRTGDAQALAPWLGKDAPVAQPLDPVRYLPCPVCSQLMHRKNFGGSGVILDWCKGHGYWFDAQELEKVMAFVKAGGLDRARERQIEEQRREVERAREAATAWQRSIAPAPRVESDLLTAAWLVLRRLLP